VDAKVPRHEKIKFRRRDLCALDSLPSARANPLPRRRVRSSIRVASYGALGLVVLAFVLAAAVYFVGNSFIASGRLQTEAQARISRALGFPVTANIGSTGLSLDRSRFVAVDIRDLSIAGLESERTLLTAGRLSFALRPRPLISGRTAFGSALLSDAIVDMSGLGLEGGAELPPSLVDANGVIVPDKVLERFFVILHATLDAMQAGDTEILEIRDVSINYGDPAKPETIAISAARLEAAEGGAFALTGEVEAAGRTFSVETNFSRAAADADAEVDLTIRGTMPKGAEQPPLENALGEFTLNLSGRENATGGRQLVASLDVDQAGVKLGAPDAVPVSGTVLATLAEGTNKIEFNRVELRAGRSRYRFTGAIGPQPPDLPPGYRYEFMSSGSLIAPGDLTEPDLPAMMSVLGSIDPSGRHIMADQLGIATGQGEIFGRAGLSIEPGKSPGVDLSLAVNRIPVGHAKTIWPWFVAPGARRWAMQHVYGGLLENTQIRLDAEPGFFGHGVPLDAERLEATFHIAGTRFDVAGAIPPVRDAVGTLTLNGMNIDIALTSGTVYMPSGRTVATKGGTLTIADADTPPLIGDLDMELEGSADAIVELASYDPIDVSRFIDLAPQDLTGDVRGKVEALIPLQAGIDREDLTWQVDLAYENLAIAKPFEGQMVTEAKGTIKAEPASTVIEAKARLSGMPATISMFEPLGENKGSRRRNFRIDTDDATRAKLMSGLSTVLSGPVTFDLNMTGTDSTQRIVADLGRSTLKLPWVGWSKGAGVPATASFALDTRDGTSRISNFVLRGETFGGSGSMSFDRNGLAALRFPSIALNRGDSAAISVDRKGSRYAINVSGKSFDARPVIRVVDAQSGRSGGEEPPPVSVTVDADIQTLGGFNGESLSDVKIAYSGDGKKIDGLRASASTKSGARFTVVDAVAGGTRRTEAQTGDAGAILRFLDVYPHVLGGTATLSLSGPADGVNRGRVEVHDFTIANDQRLNTIVANAPAGADRSANQANGSRTQFDRGFAVLEKGDGYLNVAEGVVRGPTIGSTFQGTVFDRRSEMNITGTFMPAYGLNRIFGEIPLIGQILGNGRDRGLIGITFRLTGKATEPKLQVNPLSAVAPGIFRSIFEYR